LYLLVLGECVVQRAATELTTNAVEMCDLNSNEVEDVPRLVLQLHVQLGSEATMMRVRVRPALPLTLFPWRKLRLDYPHLLTTETPPHTQRLYTQRLVEDMLVLPHAALLHRHLQHAPALREALVLLKVWLRQRGLHEGVDGWSGYLMSMLLLHLIALGHIQHTHSSYQAFKITLHYLGMCVRFSVMRHFTLFARVTYRPHQLDKDL
jgi:U3 small nucleolar RNA-associated protein 22